MRIGWFMIALVSGLALWAAIDFLLGRKQHLARADKTMFQHRQSGIAIFTEGPELFEDYFAELKSAKQHIHILFYIVQDDKISQRFLSILKEKAKEGVEVRLMVDWVGSGLKRKSVKALKEAGVEFAYSRIPRFPFLFYSSQVRNHRKITVIDGCVGYLGGFNIGKEYNNQDKKLTPWRDYHLKLTGGGVLDLQTQFLRDWREAAKINLLQAGHYFTTEEKGPITHQLVPTEGVLLEDMMFRLISQAKTAIKIGTPYFIPSKKVFTALRTAIQRGVEVTVLVPFTADHILVKEASHPYLRILMQDGADIYQYLKGFYHAKVMIIDDHVCDVGTANFDKRSMFLNYEINCLIYDGAFIRKVQDIFASDILNAQKASLRELNSAGPLLSVKEKAARAISYFL